jgi:hypothetical protein
VETELISFVNVPLEDRDILTILGLWAAPKLSSASIIRFGIQNEGGELYRIVGIGDILTFVRTIKLLRKHYWVEPLEIAEETDLHVMVMLPALSKQESP